MFLSLQPCIGTHRPDSPYRNFPRTTDKSKPDYKEDDKLLSQQRHWATHISGAEI
jgi:hypothetical protein